MTTLITGLSGFTGQYMKCELELHGHKVVGLKSNLKDLQSLTDEIKQLRPKFVIHLAALAFVGHGSPNSFYETNVIGTRNLLEALSQVSESLKSVLLASSANIYGNNDKGSLSELEIPNPLNDYAISKCAMEQIASLWSDRIPLFVVRPFNYTGCGQNINFLIPKVVSHFIEKKEYIELGNLDVWREFNDVRSVCSSYRQLLDLCPVGETINICSGKTYSLREIVVMCEELTDCSMNIKVNPKFVRANEIQILAGLNDKLLSMISEISFYDIKDTLKWMLSNSKVN